jgi:formylglycine-generating enzyme required for sulfatase activity
MQEERSEKHLDQPNPAESIPEVVAAPVIDDQESRTWYWVLAGLTLVTLFFYAQISRRHTKQSPLFTYPTAEKHSAPALLSEKANRLSKEQRAGAYPKTNDQRWIDPICGLEMIRLPVGEYLMGCEQNREERPVHTVKINELLWMSSTLVTRKQWLKVMDPQTATDEADDGYPVENLSWFDAIEFIQELNQRSHHKIRYALPSETIWEYACRAGTTSAYSWGDKSDQSLANTKDSPAPWGGKSASPVKTYPANPWGFYDLHGNLMEWCQDHWHDDYEEAPGNSKGWNEEDNQELRVIRGGAWNLSIDWARSASRSKYSAKNRARYIGFRLMMQRQT